MSVPNVPSQPPDVRLPRSRVVGCVAKLGLALLGAVFGTVLTALVALALFLPVRQTVATQVPPTAVAEAGGYAGYALAVKRVGTFVARGGDYEVWLGRRQGEDVPRGHVVPVPRGWQAQKSVTARWGAERVVLEFAGGGRVEVPVQLIRDTR
ncbi:hypothetical protein JOF53_004157 [Crossiella equi]|uniref:Uncharacterized protein n=1 Tax=Crossiella equi TaxID=130796 RepID=A0ABS5AHX9_9PSEU|nr:hypothetical protein [Crossiella equi]MBP2475285.1 hypothetical protein [Crossiella equi]